VPEVPDDYEAAKHKLIVGCGTFPVQIPDDWASTYQSYVEREVVFRTRPKHTHDPSFLPPGIVETRARLSLGARRQAQGKRGFPTSTRRWSALHCAGGSANQGAHWLADAAKLRHEPHSHFRQRVPACR